MIRVGFGIRVAKTVTYTIQFPIFILLCNHSPATLQTDGRTDVMLVA